MRNESCPAFCLMLSMIAVCSAYHSRHRSFRSVYAKSSPRLVRSLWLNTNYCYNKMLHPAKLCLFLNGHGRLMVIVQNLIVEIDLYRLDHRSLRSSTLPLPAL